MNKYWVMHVSETINMYQYCYFILTVWDYTAMLILPERCVHIFELISETKSLVKTLSQWRFLKNESVQQ